MGFLANLLAHPVISGFIPASSLLIATGQLKHVLCVEAGGHSLSEMALSLSDKVGRTHPPTLVIRAAATGFLFWSRKGLRRGTAPRMRGPWSATLPPMSLRSRLPNQAAEAGLAGAGHWPRRAARALGRHDAGNRPWHGGGTAPVLDCGEAQLGDRTVRPFAANRGPPRHPDLLSRLLAGRLGCTAAPPSDRVRGAAKAGPIGSPACMHPTWRSSPWSNCLAGAPFLDAVPPPAPGVGAPRQSSGFKIATSFLRWRATSVRLIRPETRLRAGSMALSSK